MLGVEVGTTALSIGVIRVERDENGHYLERFAEGIVEAARLGLLTRHIGIVIDGKDRSVYRFSDEDWEALRAKLLSRDGIELKEPAEAFSTADFEVVAVEPTKPGENQEPVEPAPAKKAMVSFWDTGAGRLLRAVGLLALGVFAVAFATGLAVGLINSMFN